MFLWVRLVIFTLEDLDYESDLHEAMDTLPLDLEALYMRPSLGNLNILLIYLSPGTRGYSHAFAATGRQSINVLPYEFCSGC